MKTHLFFSLSLLFVLAARSIFSVTAVSGPTAVVYDTDGKKVRQNTSYYLDPLASANGGGLKLNKLTCPLTIVQDTKTNSKGDAFTFTVIAPKEREYVREEYPLGIDSGSPKPGQCQKSTFWKIEEAKEKPPANFVTTGGEFEADESCFRVVKFPKPTNRKVKSYMLLHCPIFCGGDASTCFNVSIYADKGAKHLVSGGSPFEFVFNKAS